MTNEKSIVISIRSLVEFVLMSGSIMAGEIGGNNKALAGTKAHQRIQSSYREEYTAEVTLKHHFQYKDYDMTVQGRADGILIEESTVIIDEIKTVTKPFEILDEENPIHWGQAKCYGYIYAKDNGLQQIDIQLTYYHIEEKDIKRIRKTFSYLELETFFYSLIESYYQWAQEREVWKIKRNESIKRMDFPFPTYRKGQRQLAIAAYRTIKEGRKLFAQAPTGIGKTISTLFPAIKAMGEEITSKIFYLTAKTVTRKVAEEAIDKMKNKGLSLKSVTLTAKDKICFEKDKKCHPDECTFAKGYYDRLREALVDIYDKKDTFSRDIIEDYGIKHHICPFEFSLDIALWADVIICDYNYAFDPRVYLRRFFTEENNDYTFLIDEAHNLVDRARAMFSTELSKRRILDLKKMLKDKAPKIVKTLNNLNRFMIEVGKLCGEEEVYITKEEPKGIYPLISHFIGEVEDWLKENPGEDAAEELLELYFSAWAFLRIAEFYDDHYITYGEKKKKDVVLKLFCLDPSYLLAQGIKRGRSALFFSATLSPLSYFKEVLGGQDEDYCIRLDSPFDPKHSCLLVIDHISTKYKDREKSYIPIIQYIRTIVETKPGNYLIFFPSYQYLNKVLAYFNEEEFPFKLLVQHGDMSEEERDKFLEAFQGEGQPTVAFAVLGGIFSEGIDLVGNKLIGTIIIGVGLPQLSFETDTIMKYFEEKSRRGYEYAYMYPGMNKVMQAAGRVIRQEEDKGIICLIDSRFTTIEYQRLFPKEWRNFTTIRSCVEARRILKSFWAVED